MVAPVLLGTYAILYFVLPGKQTGKTGWQRHRLAKQERELLRIVDRITQTDSPRVFSNEVFATAATQLKNFRPMNLDALQAQAHEPWLQILVLARAIEPVNDKVIKIVKPAMMRSNGPLPASEIRNEQAQQAFFRRLVREQVATNPFPSSNLRRNRSIEEISPQSAFEEVMEPYVLDKARIKSATCNYGQWNNSDIGHKLHLNIEAKDVRGVSRYLSILGFNHKYLHGGDVSKGKVFTLYPGSKLCADRMAQQLSRDLELYICRPLAEDEIEYAPNIAGRFVERGQRFHKDGASLIRGIPLLYSDLDVLEDEKNEALITPAWMQRAFECSFAALAETYGPYFYGK